MKKLLILFICGFLFISCTTVPKFSGMNELCGVIVDENNKPVNEYVVKCGIDLLTARVAITNERGIFVFHNMPAGKYYFWGEKKGWAKIVEQPFLYNSREKMFCCKVNSLETALDNVDVQIKCGNYRNALKLLDEISYENNTPEEAVILYYQVYLNIRTGNTKTARKIFSKLDKKNEFISNEMMKKMEEEIYEKE